MGLLEEIRTGQKYVKRPIAVHVVFASTDGFVQTLEGMVTHVAGDAILSGVEGERWPMRRERFEATYEELSPTQMGESGDYVKKPVPVHAVRTQRPLRVTLEGGFDKIEAQPGDWLVADGTGAIWVVAASIFAATYRSFDALN